MNPQRPPRKQHYLPAVYLQQFSVDGQRASRESQIWRLSCGSHTSVPVHSQCHERFFYSATDAVGAERFFQTSENIYAGLIPRIWDGLGSRGDRDYFGLIIMIISLHIRNPAYENRLPRRSRIDVYKLMEQQVVHHVIMRGSPEVPTDDELLAQLKEHWRVRLILSPPSISLITSDNPAVWYTLDDSGDPHFMILPVTPQCCAVAFDCTRLCVEGVFLNTGDVEILNNTQTKSMLKAVYSNAPFPDEDQKAAPAYWASHKPPAGFIDETYWKMNVIRYVGSFSFLR